VGQIIKDSFNDGGTYTLSRGKILKRMIIQTIGNPCQFILFMGKQDEKKKIYLFMMHGFHKM